MTSSTADLDTAAAVLEFARARGRPPPRPRRPNKLQAAVTWAGMHSVDSLDQAATVWDHGETGMPVAGPGAPLVAEFSVTEFAAAIGLPTEAGKAYLGEAVELRYRLRRIWARVTNGDLPAWRARRVARETIAPVGGGRRLRRPARRPRRAQGPPRPARPARRRSHRPVHARGGRPPPPPSRRRPLLHHRHPPTLAAGHQHRVRGARPRRRPRPRRRRHRRRPGAARTSGPPPPSTCAAPPRSATSPAASSPSTSTPTDTDWARRFRGRRTRRRPSRDRGRRAEAGRTERDLEARRSGSRVRWCCTCTSPRPRSPPAPLVGEFGRVENTRGPVHAEQIRQWCGNPDAQITVQPVIDLNEHIDVEAYEIRGRLREQTVLTHPTCVFPWCTRPARALEPDEHDADCDHRVALRGGPAHLLLQHRPVVPAPSPGQDPRPLDLHRPRPRHLRVDQPARLPVPARSPRHPRRVPRPAPAPAGPLHPPPAAGPRHPPAGSRHPASRPLTPPPRTPPDHHRRGPRHVRARTGPGHDRRTANSLAHQVSPSTPSTTTRPANLSSRRTGSRQP